LEGARLRGEWRLFKMKGREQEGRPLWLLQKVEDAFAVVGDEAEVIGERERAKASSKKTAAKKKKSTATKRAGGKRKPSAD
jgi:hypothetical protein